MKKLLIFSLCLIQVVLISSKDCLTRKDSVDSRFWNLCIDNTINNNDAIKKCQSFNLTLAKISDIPLDYKTWMEWFRFKSSSSFSNQLNETMNVFSSSLGSLILEQSGVIEDLKSNISIILTEFIQNAISSYNSLNNLDTQSISDIIETFRKESILSLNDIQLLSKNSISNCIKTSSDSFKNMLNIPSCDSSSIKNRLNELDKSNKDLVNKLNEFSAKISDLNNRLNKFGTIQDQTSQLFFDLNYWNNFAILKQSYNELLIKNKLENLLDNCNMKPM